MKLDSELNETLTLIKNQFQITKNRNVIKYENDGYLVDCHKEDLNECVMVSHKTFYPHITNTSIRVLSTGTLTPEQVIAHINRIKLAVSTANQTQVLFPFIHRISEIEYNATLKLTCERSHSPNKLCFITDFENDGYEVRLHEDTIKIKKTIFVIPKNSFYSIFKRGVCMPAVELTNSNEVNEHLSKIKLALNTYQQIKTLFPEFEL